MPSCSLHLKTLFWYGVLEIYRLMTWFAYQTMLIPILRYLSWRKQFWKSWSGIWQFPHLMSFWFDISKLLLHLIWRYSTLLLIFTIYIYFFSLSSRDLTGLFLFVADVDGEYGVFSSWTGSYALSNNHFVLPFNDCCCSRFCRTLHSQQDPFLEWNSEALLRLLWRADNVSSLFFVILTCRPVVYVLLVFAAYGIMYACMGINHCWIICSLYKLCFRVPFWAKKKGEERKNKVLISCMWFYRDCAKLLVEFHSAAAESKLKVVYGKYSCSDRCAVALVPPPKSLLARSTWRYYLMSWMVFVA